MSLGIDSRLHRPLDPGYNTSTWQYEYIRLLNQKRKELGLAQPGIDSKIVAASYNHLIFKRTQADGAGCNENISG